jgi:hypothetical protein
MSQVEVAIHIGPRSETFVLAKTNAPAAYDHGSALEIYDGTYLEIIERFILVPTRDAEWQRLRNASGLHSFITDPTELIIDAGDVAQALWKRLYQEKA